MIKTPAWFSRAVVYQIYPRSFYDANGDGIGDLPGVIKKLDYLKGKPDSLGINAIWLSPFYKSPMADFGYDVSDYKDVDPIFGKLADFKLLVKEAHARDIKVIIDFVPNHTSDEHQWFLESVTSKNNPKRDWYIWKDGLSNGAPPNNWQSVFGGSAWELDTNSGQYYLHSFLKKQPDLNWDNPEVRQAMKETIKFWLELGADGFRIDAIKYISKDPAFKDNPPELVYIPSVYGPNLLKYIAELSDVLKNYKDSFMILESYPEKVGDIESYLRFYESLDNNICAPINFDLISLPWQAEAFKKYIDQFQRALKPSFIPVYNLGNHDRSRLATRIGKKAARTATMLQLTLPGMQVIYYGDELAMTDVYVPAELIQDPVKNAKPGREKGRDPERTPMLWSDKLNAGFTTGRPWLPISKNFKSINVNKQLQDDRSPLNFNRTLLGIRSNSDALSHGQYLELETDPGVYGFIRQTSKEKIAILLNFLDHQVLLSKAELKGEILCSSYMDNNFSLTKLRPNEGLVIRL